jgi:glycosyltransferase involved in cell wall biosynthesis
MRVAYLAFGAAGMYCGSCLRDNRVAATLIAQGKDVVLIPIYTPLRTDEVDVSQTPVYYGGINVFLEQYAGLFRKLPASLTRWLDAPRLLRWAMRFSGSTSASTLGKMTVSILRGEQGRQSKELHGLVDGLGTLSVDVVTLPGLMLAAAAPAIRSALKVPVVCTLSGEDIFLDDLREPYRREAFELIRKHAESVDAFIATTKYYADHAAAHFGLQRDRIHVVPLGVHADDFTATTRTPQPPFTIGYLARICEAKGLMNLCAAAVDLRRRGHHLRVVAAGYLGASDRPYFEKVRASVAANGLQEFFDFRGEVDRHGKVELLHSSDVFSVPTVYHEAKGLYVVEAMAAGVPVVQPRHGSVPELIEATGGGLLYDPASAGELVAALERLIGDEALRRTLGENGRTGVRANFTDEVMAAKTWAVFESLRTRGDVAPVSNR